MSSGAAALSPAELAQNHNVEIVTVVSVLCVLSTLMLVTRLWAKAVSRRGLAADDFVLIAAWACIMGESIMIGYAINFGLGYHLGALTLPQIISFQKAFFASAFLLPTGLALTKVSLLLLLHHIFPSRSFRMAVGALGGIVAVWWIAEILGEIFICEPLSSHWDPAARAVAKCGNQQALDLGTPIPWIVTDFAILVCPIPMLRQLQVSKPQKYGLMALFLVGILTCIVSCIRYSTLFYPIVDGTWDVVPAAVWSAVEGNITVMCASVVASRQALVFLYPKRLIESFQDRWQSYASHSRSGQRSHAKLSKGSSKAHASSNPYGMARPLKQMPHAITTEIAVNSHASSVASNGD